MGGKISFSTSLIKCLRSCIRDKNSQAARIKCTAVVKNIIILIRKKQLIKGISCRPYSLFVDEAT